MSASFKVKKRIGLIFLTAALLLIALILRLFWVQFIIGEELRQKAFAVRFRNIEVKAKRGIVYDAKGKPLAISVSTDSFYAIPAQVRKSGKGEETSRKIAEILDMNEAEVYELLNKRQAFVWIKRHVADEKAQQIKELKLEGINFVEEPERFYPKGTLLAHVLGFAGVDNQGLNGIELTYDKELGGISGTIMVEYDAKGQEIPNAVQKYIPPEDGNSVILTIDETIQYIVERELDEIMKQRKPKKAGIIVMDPNTGGILALASRPTFDPNEYQKYDSSLWRNMLVSDAYEPGSTFKTVTAAGALDEGVVKPEDRFYCSGSIKVGKESIRCWRTGRPHGSQTFVEGVQNSCNPVLAAVGLREGKDVFYRYLDGFGFGQKTGVELPGEASGILMNKEAVRDIHLATMSIGQTNAVTPIQLLTAFAAIVNGGYLMKPQIVKEIRNKDGGLVRTIEPESVKQVISRETSLLMRTILESVVSEGTGSNAYVEGYRTGGKTGTAQKIIPGGGYSSTDFIGSFMGVAPANDPQIVALIIVDTPQGVYYGGQIAAPVFKNIARDTLRYLQIPVQIEGKKLAENKQKVEEIPDVTGISVNDAVNRLEKLKMKVTVMGEGTKIKAQLPAKGTKLPLGSSVILYTSIPASGSNPEMVAVPDLTGKTIGEVKELTKMLNLNFEIQGSGVVVSQQPEPASQVPVGSRLKVVMETLSQGVIEPLSP